MQESLTRQLAIAASTTKAPSEIDQYDEMAARQHLVGLARLFQDEDLVEQVARRLYAYTHRTLWSEAESAVRNQYLVQALNIFDALRDLIADEVNPPPPGAERE